MSTQCCPYHPSTDANPARLPQTVASQIEKLRQERLSAYAEQVRRTRDQKNAGRTELERDVDELLDSLNTLHRLEQLAEYEAHGGHVGVDADRLLIAGNEDTYRKLLEVFTNGKAQGTALSAGLLISIPQPID